MGIAYERGLLLYGQRRWALAADEFRHELAVQPGNAIAHAMLGMTLLEVSHFDAAEREIYDSVGLAPELSYAHYALASLVYKRPSLSPRTERLDQVRCHLARAIQLDPKSLQNLSFLARVEYREKQWGACLRAAERGLEISPENEACRWYRAGSLWELYQHSEAVELISQTVSANPEHPATQGLLGWMLSEREEFGAAFESLDQSLRMNPNDKATQRLWETANVFRFPVLGSLHRAARRLGSAFSGAHYALLGVLLLTVFTMAGPMNRSIAVTLAGFPLLGLTPLWIKRRFGAMQTRKLRRKPFAYRLFVFFLFGLWLLVADCTAFYGILSFVGPEPREPCALSALAIALLILMPALPLFLSDCYGTAALKRLAD